MSTMNGFHRDKQVYKPDQYLGSGCRADPGLGGEQVTAGSCESFEGRQFQIRHVHTF